LVDIFHYPFPLYRLFFCPANRVWGQLCGTALAMLIWKRKEENKAEETDEEETEDFAE